MIYNLCTVFKKQKLPLKMKNRVLVMNQKLKGIHLKVPTIFFFHHLNSIYFSFLFNFHSKKFKDSKLVKKKRLRERENKDESLRIKNSWISESSKGIQKTKSKRKMRRHFYYDEKKLTEPPRS